MIIGHQKQWTLLKNAAKSDKLPHGLLFTGPAKLGKKTLALEFIKLLNCQNEDFSKRPCQICRSCQDIKKRQHPDLTIIESVQTSRTPIQISQIRELKWKLALRPIISPFKAALIDQAHRMNQEAQSCFLKTLEEPKGKSILILITEAPEMLLPTILSRVQEIKFYPVKTFGIEDYLILHGLSKHRAKTISHLSLGSPGQAIDFMSNPQKFEDQQKLISDLTKIINSDLAFRFQYIKDLSKEPFQNLKEVLETWLRFFRDLLMAKCSKPEIEHLKPDIELDNYSVSELKNILKNIESTNFLISTTNINPKLALEVLMLEL